jgi:hypothetical protein
MKSWGMKSSLLGLIASVALATGAFADNGLQRFERELKPQLELQKLSYRGAEPLGDQGFVLKDVEAVLPPTPQTDNKPSTIRIEKVTVDAIDFDRLKKDNKEDLPRFIKMRLEGVTGDEAAANSLAVYGLPKVPADIVLEYRLDPAAKRLTLDKFEITLRGQGSISLSLVIDGVDDKASTVEDARDSGRLQKASLTIDDKGIVARVLETSAKSQGNTPEGVVAIGLMTIQAFAGQQDAESLKAFDAVASFITDWRAPKGPITLTVTPANGASLADIGTLIAPNALRTVLGLDVVYAGTRPGAATAK